MGGQDAARQHRDRPASDSALHRAGEAELAVFGPETWAGSGAAVGRGIAPPPLAAFLTAAHELRAPLAWLLGEVQSLRDQTSGPLNPAQLESTRQIAETCVRMQRIVEDCFAYGRLENGEMSFHADVAAIDPLMQELAGAWSAPYAKKGVQLHARAKGVIEPFPCDPHKIMRVVSILLENALKFTPPGGEVELGWQPCIWVRGEPNQPRDEPGQREANAACISVRDTGPGIAPENQLEIFEPFVSLNRGDADLGVGIGPGTSGFRRRRDDAAPGLGLGLGLAVARRLVQWHGGKIWVETEIGRGSTFCVMLPLHAKS
jgi:signal transduction histidine kinase